MIKDTLLKSNPWWSTSKIPDYIPKLRRDVFYLLNQEIPKDRISALVGPRRVGKTTIMYQIISELLQNRYNPKNILYVSFDYSRGSIEEVIESYQELMNPSGKIYCFFDEIHYVSDWSLTLKNYYDFNNQFKLFISGSSSTLLYSTTESLVGRIFFIPVLPMTFNEFVRIKSQEKTISKELELIRSISIDKIEDIFNIEFTVLQLRNFLKHMLFEYILWGGFPEYLKNEYTIEEWQNYLRQNFIILTIFKDILSVYSVREPKALENLILLIADKQCLPLNYYSISKIIGINKETVSNYFRYLESAHLIIEASYYARNTTKKITKEKKYYIADTGLRNALMGESILKDDILSTDIEGAVAQHLINLQARMDARLFYWKDKYEVDFIYNGIPIEVKFKDSIKLSELKGLRKFLEQSESKYGIVVTKDLFKVRANIYFLPAWLFLFIVYP
ncbi:MAG: ATP-binding protein [Methanosarcinales archaeon]|nr:ATP-binding protein [Methanosarcinales archaeon]